MEKTTVNCNNCKKEINIKNVTECEFCTNKLIDENSDNSDNSDEDNVNSIPPVLYCYSCSNSCYVCNEKGCIKCIECVCCDCCESMCPNCAYSGEPNCGCYGKCTRCNTDVNRGENGWPCNDCRQWLCSRCSSRNNNCTSCGTCDSNEESDEESSKDSD